MDDDKFRFNSSSTHECHLHPKLMDTELTDSHIQTTHLPVTTKVLSTYAADMIFSHCFSKNKA